MLKRGFDLLTSTMGLIATSWAFLILSILIKLDSKGPIFFRQVRVGRNGKNFRIFKFRTMHPGRPGGLVTRGKDPRITRMGSLLRATKLDELPQLINVFIGNMSIVGPRPEIPELVATYTEEQKKLLEVKPGITSPATIYHRDEEEIVGTAEDVEEYHRKVLIPRKASYDLNYIEQQSFFYDIKLILLTLVSVVTNESGYMREKTLKNRRLLIWGAHLLLSALAYWLAYQIRFDWNPPIDGKINEVERMYHTGPLLMLFDVTFLALFGLNRGYWRYVHIKELIDLAYAVILSTIAMFFFEIFALDVSYPTGVIFMDGLLSFFLFATLRFSLRFVREAYYPIIPKGQDKVLILGASDRGVSLMRNILSDPEVPFEVIGFVDQEISKRGLKIHGYRVLGTLSDLESILRTHEVHTVINTYGHLNREETTLLVKATTQRKINIKTLPPLSEVLSGQSGLNRLRDIRYEELLGREEVKLDQQLLDQRYRGRVVMITGAGGSIGSELVRQLDRFEPELMVLVDKDESLLYEIETEIRNRHPESKVESVICDIRHQELIREVFSTYKPEIVMHAAAYKHVPMMEKHGREAILNNVLGSYYLMKEASESGVKRFIMISSDKAVRPTNVMGASKRLSERIMYESIAPQSEMKCVAVRFGNVLGSRGSVVPLFRKQITRGGPVKVTHPEISRFFMSIPEAGQLVLQAGAMSDGNELFILKMGDPVKIADLARNLIEFSGLQPELDIQIEYTGLRPGEKMYEELYSDLEGARATSHEKILEIDMSSDFCPELIEELKALETGVLSLSNEEVREILKKWVSDYEPFLVSK